MNKLSKLTVSLVLALTLIGCTAKTKVDLNTVVFKSIYVGEESGAIPGAMMTMNLTESNRLKYHLDLPRGVKISSASSEELAQSVLVLIDKNGNQFTFYDGESQSFLKIKSEKSAPIYYRYDYSVKDLIQTDMASTIYGLVIKDRIKSMFYNQAESDLVNKTSFSRFTMTQELCSDLIDHMDVDSWLMIANHQTVEPRYKQLGLYTQNGYELTFAISPEDGKASVAVHYREADEEFYDVFSMTNDLFYNIRYAMVQIQDAVQIKPGNNLLNDAYNKATVYGTGVDNVAAIVDLDPSEGDDVKTSLQLVRWIKQDIGLALVYREVVLETESGLNITIGQSQEGPIAVVTSSNDPAMKEVYGLPDNVSGIAMTILAHSDCFAPTEAMLNFVPVKLIIMDAWDESSEPQMRTYVVDASTAADLKAILNIPTWIKDPNPENYAFGWMWKFYLEDKDGRKLHIYNYGNELTPVHVDGFFPVVEWIWFDASGTLIDELAKYIQTKYPKP